MSLLLLYRGLTAPSGGGGGDYPAKPKKRFFVRHNEQLFAFKSKREAISAIRQIELNQDVKPQELVSLPAVAEYAKVAGKIEAYNAAYQSKQYAALLLMFETMREEEDIEILLMGM